MAYVLKEIVAQLGGQIIGNEDIVIERIGTLEKAKGGDIAFLSNPRYRQHLQTTQASAAIVSPSEAEHASIPVIVTDNPYLYFARLAQLLHPVKPLVPGVHPTAIVDETATIAPTAEIGPGVVIGQHSVVDENTYIGPRTVIGDHCIIGADCRLHPNVTLYDRVQIGDRTIIHAGAVIGADGFGFAEDHGRWEKIPQIGGVIIGTDVEIGANTTVDAGAIEPTQIDQGVKIDNLVMIAHNVQVGEHTVMAACTGISGSTKIGRHCRLGGSVGTAGHLEIADGTVLMASANVTKSITQPGIYSSCIPVMPQRQWLKNIAHLKNLDEMAHTLKKLDSHTHQETDE